MALIWFDRITINNLSKLSKFLDVFSELSKQFACAFLTCTHEFEYDHSVWLVCIMIASKWKATVKKIKCKFTERAENFSHKYSIAFSIRIHIQIILLSCAPNESNPAIISSSWRILEQDYPQIERTIFQPTIYNAFQYIRACHLFDSGGYPFQRSFVKFIRKIVCVARGVLCRKMCVTQAQKKIYMKQIQ